MTSFTPTPDISVIVTSPTTSSERRITPSWTVAQLKQKLEFVTGIPPSAQQLSWKAPGAPAVPMDAGNQELSQWGLVKGGEIEVSDTRGPQPTLTSLLADPAASNVEKFTLPTQTYESLSNSVLNWKRTNQLGRFDPSAKSPDQIASERLAKDQHEIDKRGIEVGKRCLVGGDPTSNSSSNRKHHEAGSEEEGRRGTIRYVGSIEELPGFGLWVGVECDEPVGKNDGSVKGGRKVFECVGGNGGGLRGLFVRPERVHVGDFEPLDDFKMDEEEI